MSGDDETGDGLIRIERRFEDETLWLTQAQIAELFATTPQNVTIHVKAIYAEGELAEQATCKSYLQVRREESREVTRSLRHPSGETSEARDEVWSSPTIDELAAQSAKSRALKRKAKGES